MSEARAPGWICAQLGGREHYAVPRALHARDRLRLLLSDFWARPGSIPLRLLPGAAGGRLRERFHPSLADAPVLHLGGARIVFDLMAKVRRWDSWQTTMERNHFFQQRLLAQLDRQPSLVADDTPGVFFTYAYAGRELMKHFKARGWKIILGQIDPGEEEQRIVAHEHLTYAEIASTWRPAPQSYWRYWRDECDLADVILVNSHWPAEALAKRGISPAKIRTVPLAFESADDRPLPPKQYPEIFDDARPLRVLFLGQLTLRKGVHLALEAARMLRNHPIEWTFVGPSEIPAPHDPGMRVSWRGPVSRLRTAGCYERADVFILPTLSDGFGLTQLEAQAARLPVLASRFCGRVVSDGVNGLLIDPLDARTIAGLIQRCLANPGLLARLSAASDVGKSFSYDALERNLIELENHLPGPPP